MYRATIHVLQQQQPSRPEQERGSASGEIEAAHRSEVRSREPQVPGYRPGF